MLFQGLHLVRLTSCQKSKGWTIFQDYVQLLSIDFPWQKTKKADSPGIVSQYSTSFTEQSIEIFAPGPGCCQKRKSSINSYTSGKFRNITYPCHRSLNYRIVGTVTPGHRTVGVIRVSIFGKTVLVFYTVSNSLNNTADSNKYVG